VLLSLKSKSKMENKIFPDKLRASLKVLAQSNQATKSAMAKVEKEGSYLFELITRPKPETTKNRDVFLSHVQQHHTDFCRLLYYRLQANQVKVWYDKMEDRLDLRGMIDGILNSNEFVIVMAYNYFDRSYCVFEFLVALAFQKPITVLLEEDKRFGGTTIERMKEEVPRLYYDIIITHEIVKINRELFEAFIEKVVKRVGRHRLI